MIAQVRIVLAFLLIVCSTQLFASPQVPDYLIFGKDTIETYNLILEEYLHQQDTSRRDELFGLTFRDGATSNCWRGYQAVYKIENDSLFLIHVIDCMELARFRNIHIARSQEKMKSIFGEKFRNGKVFIDWFSGKMSFPLTKNVLRWDGVFYTIFEREKVITLSNGFVRKIEDFDNYVDDPMRIDRCLIEEIPDLLFRKLKNVSWKNNNDFECSDKYWITIDESGRVSKVATSYDDEVAKWDAASKSEYNYCISKIYKALKPLRFDIIKDKGKPISEEVFIDIWFEDNGEIKRW